MSGKARPPVWIVIGPLDTGKLPARRVVERVPDGLLKMLSAFLGMAKDEAAPRR